MIFNPWTMQTMGQVHLPLWNLNIFIRNFENLAAWSFCRKYDSSDYGLVHVPQWNLDDFHSLDNANYRSGPSAIMKCRWFPFFGPHKLWVWSICHFETYRFFIRNYENLADWSFWRKYDSSDYGLVHLPLWNLDDFHSLDNANYRSGPSATLKPRWLSLFGQCKL